MRPGRAVVQHESHRNMDNLAQEWGKAGVGRTSGHGGSTYSAISVSYTRFAFLRRAGRSASASEGAAAAWRGRAFFLGPATTAVASASTATTAPPGEAPADAAAQASATATVFAASSDVASAVAKTQTLTVAGARHLRRPSEGALPGGLFAAFLASSLNARRRTLLHLCAL